MNYYAKEEPIILREYGKLIQKYVQEAILENDKEKRTKIAYAIVDYMAQLTPSVKSTENYKEKLWDHLFFISDYKLDVDAPFTIAEREFIVMTPTKLEYPNKKIEFKHYGKYIVKFIEEAKNLDEDKKKVVASPIASYMKVVHKTWNNEVVNDSIVKNDLSRISSGELEMAEDESIRHLMPKNKNNNNKNNNNKNRNNNNNNNNNNNKNRNNNNNNKNKNRR